MGRSIRCQKAAKAKPRRSPREQCPRGGHTLAGGSPSRGPFRALHRPQAARLRARRTPARLARRATRPQHGRPHPPHPPNSPPRPRWRRQPPLSDTVPPCAPTAGLPPAARRGPATQHPRRNATRRAHEGTRAQRAPSAHTKRRRKGLRVRAPSQCRAHCSAPSLPPPPLQLPWVNPPPPPLAIARTVASAARGAPPTKARTRPDAQKTRCVIVLSGSIGVGPFVHARPGRDPGLARVCGLSRDAPTHHHLSSPTMDPGISWRSQPLCLAGWLAAGQLARLIKRAD